MSGKPQQYDDHGQPAYAPEVGVGAHPLPWPTDERYDKELLAAGDRRNILDCYRYWNVAAIVADLDLRRHPFEVAIENLAHDMNIGTVVRSANAFMARRIHIVGRKRWNRRGAMVTDRYQHIEYHVDSRTLIDHAREQQLPIIGIDNLPGSQPIEHAKLPERCILLFGQESTGLSAAAVAACDSVYAISQFGSTRSINAGVAAGIAMHTWISQHAKIPNG
ncbi:MAG: TrmH family RNA methyltransferase [Antricoccus sp.]